LLIVAIVYALVTAVVHHVPAVVKEEVFEETTTVPLVADVRAQTIIRGILRFILGVTEIRF
jgi:hypothetical protein